jgi:imidazolonepropionase-like amidohydrolase
MRSKAGISNLEILRTGTINPALYFDQKGEWGVIKKGAVADFVLVEKNSSQDLSTMKRSIMVIMGKNSMIVQGWMLSWQISKCIILENRR